ncbi:hypothetical protein [uncultured Victivallis sp.]|uniref:hypothetical protein n=1 Tax=uncultured Victivallis sp. TaxID=354118 RepID=UPI0025EEBE79|nr:hypothetical protein [uncultured Victivallis sp.]
MQREALRGEGNFCGEPEIFNFETDSSAGRGTTSQTCLRNHLIKHTVCRTHHPQVNEKRNSSGEGHVRKPFMMVWRVGDSSVLIQEKKRDNSQCRRGKHMGTPGGGVPALLSGSKEYIRLFRDGSGLH